ncbi:MAG: response regulator transcription factor [Ignavibacteriae bacterium]|nr:response regulator transcription factor [Ignavibacteriota bacterium]
MSTIHTVIIADDHPMFRSGVKQALEQDAFLRVIAEASNGQQALQLIQEHSPRAVVLDINMPQMTGLQVVRELRKQKISIAVTLLTMFDDEDILNEAMELDVKAYILKESASLDVVKAVHHAIQGKYFISASLSSKLVQRKERQTKVSQKFPGLAELTDTERKILKLIADSKTSKEIADELFLSPKTIDNYRFKISEKLNLTGSYSLLKFALENKAIL